MTDNTTEQVSFRIEVETMQELKRVAEIERRSISEMCRIALANYVPREPGA